MRAPAAAKRLARQALRHIGLERIRTPSLARFLASERIATVLDVGANEGQFALELREHGYRGAIISFEPIGEVFRRLERRAAADPRWQAHNFALGAADGEATIHVSGQSVFSSMKPRSAYMDETFSGSRVVRDEPVRIVRLDSFLALHPQAGRNALLKVDTQGFEAEVLAGAGERLRDLAAVQLELPMEPLYAGQEDWIGMVQRLAAEGFSVAMVKENSYDWSRMRLLELDILFVNDRPRP